MHAGTFKTWHEHSAKATWLVNTRGSVSRADPAQSELPHTVEGAEVPTVHVICWGKLSVLSQGKCICGVAFAQRPRCTWWIMQEDRKARYVSQRDLIWDEKSHQCKMYHANHYMILLATISLIIYYSKNHTD